MKKKSYNDTEILNPVEFQLNLVPNGYIIDYSISVYDFFFQEERSI